LSKIDNPGYCDLLNKASFCYINCTLWASVPPIQQSCKKWLTSGLNRAIVGSKGGEGHAWIAHKFKMGIRVEINHRLEGEKMETLESIGIFLGGLGLLFAGLSGTILMLAKTDETVKRTKAIREEKRQA